MLESAGSLQVGLVLNKPVDQQVNVSVMAIDITATGVLNVFCIFTVLFSFNLAGNDFGPSQNYTVNFIAGSISQSVNIPIIIDNINEGNETFQLVISVPEEAVAAGVIDGCDPFTPSVTIEIINEDSKLYIP